MLFIGKPKGRSRMISNNKSNINQSHTRTHIETIGGREPSTAHSQHTAIFWHLCGNFRMSRGTLQKLQRRNRYEKRLKLVFCTESKKGAHKYTHAHTRTHTQCNLYGLNDKAHTSEIYYNTHTHTHTRTHTHTLSSVH